MTTIREERARRHISQRKLAELANVSFSSVQRLEQGAPVTNRIAEAVCAALAIQREQVRGIVSYNAVQTALERRPKTEKPR